MNKSVSCFIRVRSAFVFLLVAGAAGCSGKSADFGKPDGKPITPAVIAEIPKPMADKTLVSTLSTGDQIILHDVGGVRMFAVEGVLTDEAFLSLKARSADIAAELGKVTAKFAAKGAISLTLDRETGYFTLLLPFERELFAQVKSLWLEHRVILNPVLYQPGIISEAKAFGPQSEGLTLRTHSSGGRGDGRGDTRGYSGLEAIRAPEFVKQVEQELAGVAPGTKINGSDVVVGITDTGITYNHPSFRSASGENRIVYMKDLTGEGMVYFPAAAKFEAVAGATDAELVVNATVVVTPKLPARPRADQLEEVKDLKIKVSPAVRAAITAAGATVKLGFINEAVFQAKDEPTDINANGKLDDKLYLLLVQGAAPTDDVVYFDAKGTADFSKSEPLGDWNKTRQVVRVYAEKIGFAMSAQKLVKAEGSEETETVHAVTLVGFDPGNHGSHVAGISSGLKTIANDEDLTLARGVAPESKIAMNRVCSNNSGCNATQALVDMANNAPVSVINMSLGGLSPFNDGYGVQETVINRLTQLKNILFVISAGNSGPGRQTVGSPSVARFSLSVGASASRELIQRQYQWPGSGPSDGASAEGDFMLFFSSRGPTAAGGFKPNLVAPGTELSAIQLNSAPGATSGVAVYWGTSMSAPTATGAYALLVDAIKKHNVANPAAPLTTNALTLRQVLIETASPFDANRFDPETGEHTQGQYTWVDQGTGMLNLPAAWAELKRIRDQALPPSFADLDGKPIELVYEGLTEMKIAPNGNSYDGSRPSPAGVAPAFGTGLYLDYFGKETLKQVHIARRLPESSITGDAAGELAERLKTTRDEFVFKTVYYGSAKSWLKVGVRDQLPCGSSDTANLSVLGRGVEFAIDEEGKAKIVPQNASVLNVCLDRQTMVTELQPGDHGALISAYRTVGGKVAELPSFVVPVFLTVPHQTLAGNTAYEIDVDVKSFGLKRNYVRVPKGTSVVRVSLEVPEVKLDRHGLPLTETCSGVELMSLEGLNTAKSFATRPEARVMSCAADGAPSEAKKRVLVLNRTNPTPGIWDLHVFGIYKYAASKSKLRVDYVVGNSSVEKIGGDLTALNGSFTWELKEASIAVRPDSAKSSLDLTGLAASNDAVVKQDENLVIESPLGKMRKYPEGTKTVTITTGKSPGNDLDMDVVECPVDLAAPDAAKCETVAQSGGPTDEESATFKVKAGKVYAATVHGYAVKDEGKFVTTETLTLETETGAIVVGGEAPSFVVAYSFSPEALATSKLANHPLFIEGKYSIAGSLTLRTSEDAVLDSLPVLIKK